MPAQRCGPSTSLLSSDNQDGDGQNAKLPAPNDCLQTMDLHLLTTNKNICLITKLLSLHCLTANVGFRTIIHKPMDDIMVGLHLYWEHILNLWYLE